MPIITVNGKRKRISCRGYGNKRKAIIIKKQGKIKRYIGTIPITGEIKFGIDAYNEYEAMLKLREMYRSKKFHSIDTWDASDTDEWFVEDITDEEL